VLALSVSLAPSLASGDEPSLTVKVEQRVQQGLLKPLTEQQAKMSRFSRARPPPHENRVRVTQTTATLDASGRPFAAFAIDVRYGSGKWIENNIVGCAYVKTGDLFIKRGEAYLPASILLGKPADPVPGACVAAKPARA
jgi:hypothetical protein